MIQDKELAMQRIVISSQIVAFMNWIIFLFSVAILVMSMTYAYQASIKWQTSPASGEYVASTASDRMSEGEESGDAFLHAEQNARLVPVVMPLIALFGVAGILALLGSIFWKFFWKFFQEDTSGEQEEDEWMKDLEKEAKSYYE